MIKTVTLAVALMATVSMPIPATGAEISGKAEIIDADTLKVGGIPIRLEGIDAPESLQVCLDASGAEYPCGRIATRSLADLIGGKSTSCEIAGRDSFDRILGYCSIDGREINRAMVEAGQALAFRKYSDRYVAAENVAQMAGVGLWAGTFQAPWEWRADVAQQAQQNAGATGNDCTIKGNISKSGERIYHMPFHQFYSRTKISENKGERWFCNEDEAQAAGWRRALR